MEIQKSAFTCTREGLTIRGMEYRPAGAQLPAMIISHGFGGSAADEIYYAEQMSALGYVCFIFDFCGGSPASKSDGSFQDMTVFTEKQDLEAVMEYALSRPYVNPADLTLMGCSQGGFVSALTAAAHPDRVARLILFYPAASIPDDSRRGHMLVYTFDPANVPEQIPAPEGAFISEPLGRKYVVSVQQLDGFSAMAAYPGPVLIVHGDADDAVKLSNSQRALAAYNGAVADRCRLEVIPGAGHGFNRTEDTLALKYVRGFLGAEV